MFNLFDILQAQGGGVQSLGQQFGLSPDQSRRAMEALLPALTIGLQRNAASDPVGFGRLFGLAGTDPQAGGRAFAQPDMLLGQLFGSPALSQAVLQQAAAVSGIGQQALRQMLPIMAGMVVAGLVHAMLNQPPPPPPARDPQPQPPSVYPAADFWNEWMSTFLSSAGSAGGSDAKPPSRMEKPADRREEGGRQERKVAERPDPAPAPPKSAEADPAKRRAGDASDVPLEVFQQMFQTGVQVQEQNVKAMQDIFDSFWSEPPERAPETDDAVAPSSPSANSSQKRKPEDAKTRAAKSRSGNPT